MKTKIVAFLLLIACVASFWSCVQTIPITRYEQYKILVGAQGGYAKDIPYALALEYLAYHNSTEESYYLYLPKEGEFTDAEGNALVAHVEKVTYYNIPQGRKMEYVLSIYSAEGELIVSEPLLSVGATSVEDIPSLEVSEEMASYWNAVKTLSSDLLEK